MKPLIAYWLMFAFGWIAGACCVVALAAVLAQDSGAGYLSRHIVAAKG